jgi:hypothetical protein
MKKFLLAFGATVIVFLLLRWQSAPLITSNTPTGILALEFCDNIPELKTILNVWNLNTAVWAVMIDFLFIAAFGVGFYYGSKLVLNKLPNSFTRFMVSFSFVAPFLDIIEDVLMLITLSGTHSTFILQLTKYVALIKFAAAAIVVLYLLVSLLIIYGIPKKTVNISE